MTTTENREGLTVVWQGGGTARLPMPIRAEPFFGTVPRAHCDMSVYGHIKTSLLHVEVCVAVENSLVT
jgi:hypothetical protein